MSKIRAATTTGIENKEVRELMEKFWESYDKLFKDMDNLTKEEFFEREHEMWSWRNKASAIDGDYFLISLWGMSKKAEELFGKDATWEYIQFSGKKSHEEWNKKSDEEKNQPYQLNKNKL